MALVRGLKHDKVRRELIKATKEIPELRRLFKQDVSQKVREISGGGALVLDTTRIYKEYARKIQGLKREGEDKAQGITLAAFGWTDMKDTFLPVDLLVPANIINFEFKNLIEHAITLAQQLGVPTILADAIFASIHGFSLLDQTKIYGVMRFHNNRVVDVEGFGEFQLRRHPAFHFSRNKRCIVRTITWHNLKLQVIAIKLPHRTKKWHTLFLVTNAPFSKALEYAEYYKHRWKIEPTFRTTKQSFGLQDCQARSIRMQEAHYFASFLAFRFLKYNKPKDTPKKNAKNRKNLIQRKIRNISFRRVLLNRMNHTTA